MGTRSGDAPPPPGAGRRGHSCGMRVRRPGMRAARVEHSTRPSQAAAPLVIKGTPPLGVKGPHLTPTRAPSAGLQSGANTQVCQGQAARQRPHTPHADGHFLAFASMHSPLGPGCATTCGRQICPVVYTLRERGNRIAGLPHSRGCNGRVSAAAPRLFAARRRNTPRPAATALPPAAAPLAVAEGLPIAEVIGDICASLDASNCLVLQVGARPGWL